MKNHIKNYIKIMGLAAVPFGTAQAEDCGVHAFGVPGSVIIKAGCRDKVNGSEIFHFHPKSFYIEVGCCRGRWLTRGHYDAKRVGM